MKHTHHTGFWENAGMIGLTLPHGRDEKENKDRSSSFKTESAPADMQLHSGLRVGSTVPIRRLRLLR